MNWPKNFVTAAALLSTMYFAPIAQSSSGVDATFKIEKSQATSCERTRRFNEFMFLAATLADQITKISVTYNTEYKSCADRIAQSLRKINLSVESAANENQKDAVIITIQIGSTGTVVTTTEPKKEEVEKKTPEQLAQDKIDEEKKEAPPPIDTALSLPIIIKLATGYTLLTPLPDEQVRDRPTIEGTIRSQPFISDIFFMGSTSVSLKSGSKLPWAVIASGLVATDLFYLRDNISVPFGLGVRGFKAQVNKQDATSSQSARKNIVIPEQVLGPIAQIGIAYRSGLLTADAYLAITPIMAVGSPLITTLNASLMLGYQITPVDSIIVNTLRHDVRYPTIDSYVKVIVASITIGYQRDLL
jgi:hypothetical protein